MVTFTQVTNPAMLKYKEVSVGCRPNGHFHLKARNDGFSLFCFSGLSPEWSLSLVSANYKNRESSFSGLSPEWSLSLVNKYWSRWTYEFQWAVARMVTFTGVVATDRQGKCFSGLSPEWSLSLVLRTMKLQITCFSGLSPEWSLSPHSNCPICLLSGFQWAVARMVTFTELSPIEKTIKVFQWAVAQMVTFTEIGCM